MGIEGVGGKSRFLTAPSAQFGMTSIAGDDNSKSCANRNAV